MGYQESLVFCDSKENMIRLCKMLNKAAADSSERGLEYAGLKIFEVARLMQDIRGSFPWRAEGPTYFKGMYLIWWGGERENLRDDEFLLSRYSGRAPYWESIFADYIIPDPRELLKGIKESLTEELQENDWIRTFHPGKDKQISLELIEQL